MKEIALLDQNTIDKIAAGEVIERPASVVKELVENAIDAGANAITVEIKDGGTSLIRITDNGEGIPKDQVPLAFLRHSTSKIRQAEDLLCVSSLGFRGEALSSIAAVCQVELITKTAQALTGTRYLIYGSVEKDKEEIGAPSGTTFIVRNLFFNTPARKKFLKSPTTEAGYVSDLMERMALSHPDISFKFINNNQTRLHTSGNSNLKDIIYGIYGREVAANLTEIEIEQDGIKISGFIGKPVISRGNRNFENYFINGRYIKSSIISKAIEEGYDTFMMKHKYPFTALHFDIPTETLDVNVHPTKMELRFSDNEGIFRFISDTIRQALSKKELIPEVTVSKDTKKAEIPEWKRPIKKPEPFEQKRQDMIREQTNYKTAPDLLPREPVLPVPQSEDEDIKSLAAMFAQQQNMETLAATVHLPENEMSDDALQGIDDVKNPASAGGAMNPANMAKPGEADTTKPGESVEDAIPGTNIERSQDMAEPLPAQMNLFADKLLSKEHVQEHRIIGQVFGTYWLIEFQDKLYIIDQHAAHEKVLYEQIIKNLDKKQYTSQQLSPPLVLTLSLQEEVLLQQYMDNFVQVGFEIEPFGGKEYSIRAVPGNLFGLASQEVFLEMLDSLAAQTGKSTAKSMNEKIASISCKAAVKGNHKLSQAEAYALIVELLTLENPYNCPHGRPTIISMSKYELEKKFKRIM